jgi:hypothetical protein
VAALIGTEAKHRTTNALHLVFVYQCTREYTYLSNMKFRADWDELVRLLERDGLVVRLDETRIRLTEQGRTWLYDRSDGQNTNSSPAEAQQSAPQLLDDPSSLLKYARFTKEDVRGLIYKGDVIMAIFINLGQADKEELFKKLSDEGLVTGDLLDHGWTLTEAGKNWLSST